MALTLHQRVFSLPQMEIITDPEPTENAKPWGPAPVETASKQSCTQGSGTIVETWVGNGKSQRLVSPGNVRNYTCEVLPTA